MQKDKCIYSCKEECPSFCPKFETMNFLIESAQIPDRFVGQQVNPLLFSGPAGSKYKKIKSYIANINRHVKNGDNLFIASEQPGTGKTTLACIAMMNYFDNVWKTNGLKPVGLYISVAKYLIDIKNFEHPIPEETYRLMLDADLVIWDDIAACSKLTDFEYSKLFAIIDYRFANNKSNIFTSNCTNKEELGRRLTPRLVSRIFNSSRRVVIDVANDLRKRDAMEDEDKS